MASNYERYERSTRRQSAQSRRNGLTYWIPLAITVSVAVVGVAAWIWSERNDDEEEERGPDGSRRPDYGRNPDGSIISNPPSYADVRPGEVAYGTAQRPTEESQSYMARMSGALRRTPSPQQFMEGASRSIVAGVAATGAIVGNALSSIREEDRNAYKDHKTWSEEADRQPDVIPGPAPGIEMRSVDEAGTIATATSKAPVGNQRRKTVAIVVSADTNDDGMMDEDDTFIASILSHLPQNTDFSKIRLFVLIYAPGLKEHPLDVAASKAPGSLSSSISMIGHEQAQTPTEELHRTLSSSSTSPAFNAIYAQALSLVEKETMVLPFTTKTGHEHILRHLNPEIVYLQEALSGHNGEVITHLQTWLRNDVVVVVGAEGGSGGLADSESEAEHVPKQEQWWEREDRVGRGRGVVVVEGLRVGDDWARRVLMKE